MFKSNGGFTLVELIVVIAILGLLAGIGVPAYSKYVNTAKTEANEVQASLNADASEINKAISDGNLGWETLATTATQAPANP